MKNMDLEFPAIILSVLLGISVLITTIVTADHYGALDTHACIELIKDKTAQEIILICRGR